MYFGASQNQYCSSFLCSISQSKASTVAAGVQQEVTRLLQLHQQSPVSSHWQSVYLRPGWFQELPYFLLASSKVQTQAFCTVTICVDGQFSCMVYHVTQPMHIDSFSQCSCFPQNGVLYIIYYGFGPWFHKWFSYMCLSVLTIWQKSSCLLQIWSNRGILYIVWKFLGSTIIY